MLHYITATITPDASSAESLSGLSWAIYPVFFIVAWVGLGYLWNYKYRPRQTKAGRATQSFNAILGKVIRLAFFEDKYPMSKVKNPTVNKWLTWRNGNLAMLVLSVVMSLFGNPNAAWAWIMMIVVISMRSSKVFSQRHRVLMRMFEVAAVELKYPRNANLSPWAWVTIKQWDKLVIPGTTNVQFPASYKSEDQKNRENFERHFNGTVTDDNTWVYEWKSSQSTVICSPVEHIPSMAHYPGSADREWNEIPIGLGANGEVVWDIKTVPHALITGTTGGGKSTIQRNLIFHCIQHSGRWSFLGVDVKRVELKPYIKYDSAVVGIATNVEDGVEICRFARDEMMDRYEKMEEIGVNHFLDLPNPPKALMLMIDESYMFLAPSGIKTDEGKAEDELKGEASKILGDIARLGRASGVHLVLATQRPDAKVIYGELKQNLAARIAAGKMDSIASSMTLDNENATRLPGGIKGRGFYQQFGEGEQFQGYFAPQDWIDKWLAGEVVVTGKPDEDGKSKKKRKSRKKDPEGTQAAPETSDNSAPTPAKPKKGLLGKIQAFNDAHAPSKSESDSSADEAETKTAKKTTYLQPEVHEDAFESMNSHDFEAELLNDMKNENSGDFDEYDDDFEKINNVSEAPKKSTTPLFDEDDFDFMDEVITPVAPAPVKSAPPTHAPVKPTQMKPPAPVKPAPVKPTPVPASSVPEKPVRPQTAIPTRPKAPAGIPPRPALPKRPQMPQ